MSAERDVAKALRGLLTKATQGDQLWGAFPNTMTVDDLAAHVVAALTNAGHLLLNPDDVERLGMVLVYTPIHDKTRVPLQVLMRRYDETAAARVAEGGDQP
ncbi:hypothetical protein [Promicromonospora sukumoe]